jgi:vancomycin resistance protein YoaR
MLATVVLMLLSLVAGYNIIYHQRVFIGVHTGSLSLGGFTAQQTERAIYAWWDTYQNEAITLRHGERAWTASPAELGLSPDVDATVQNVFAIGRTGNFLRQAGDRLRALLNGRSIDPNLKVEAETTRQYLQKLAQDIDRPVQDARLVIDDAGLVQVAPARAGERLLVEDNIRRLDLMYASARGFELVVEVTPPSTLESHLQDPVLAQYVTTGEPFTIKYGDVQRTFTVSELGQIFTPAGNAPNAWPAYRANLAPIRVAVEQMAKQLDKKPIEAKLEKIGDLVTVTSSAPGLTVEVEASINQLRSQLLTDQRTMELIVRVISPGLSSSEVAATQDKLRQILSEPLLVRLEDETVTYPKDFLAASIQLKDEQVNGQRLVRLTFDEAKLKEVVEGMAKAFDRSPKDVNARYKDGKVFILEEAKDGVKVKGPETIGALATALLDGKHDFTPVVEKIAAKTPGTDIQRIVVDQMLMDSRSSYAGSIAAKRHNIELATSKLDGTLVAPGEIFSFNNTLGPTRVSDGYQMGYAIAGGGDVPVTIQAEGGGICQVATTLFQSVFWAGIKVVERWPHMYWIYSYGTPPRGMRGLDATIDGATLDLRFENNTGNYLAIRAWTEESQVHFELWGKEPGWRVEIDKPVITDVVEADDEIIYRDDPTMKPGQTLKVETAMNGFKSSIKRRVYDKATNKLLYELDVRSSYTPSRNVVLVHPRPATATPAASPSVSGTPSASRTPGPGTPAPVPTKPAPLPTNTPSGVSTPRSQPTVPR